MAKLDRITRTTVRGLARGEKVTARGVIAERLSDGDVRYSVQIMVDGERIARVIGRESDGCTPTQAEQFIEAARTKAREGRLELPQGRKLQMSFDEAAKTYLERMESTGGKDLKNKKRHLNDHLVPHFRGHRIDQLKDFALRQYRKQRTTAGASEATVNREFSTLLHLLNRAIEWKWLKAENKPPIPRAKETRKQIRILTEGQSADLLEAAIADHDERLWLFVLFGLDSSMRHGEILARRYDEVDFDHCRIWIDRAKAGEREQPITRRLRDALLRQRDMEDDADGWIFPATRKDCKQPHRTAMDDGFRRAAKAAGLDPNKVTPHVMRHTAITRLVKAGVDIPTIQRISGHKTAAMVLHYTHIHGAHIDHAVAVLDGSRVRTITSELPVAAETGADLETGVVTITASRSAA